MTRTIVTYPHPVLKHGAQQVEEVTDELKALVNDMVETMYASKGIGLAAPQVGHDCALITIDVSGDESRDNLIVLFNPVIEAREGERESEEACLSVPEFTCTVKRAEKVTVSGLDAQGKPIRFEADGLLAVCLQHEIDHLQGRLILDHAGRLKRSMYDKKINKWQKKAS